MSDKLYKAEDFGLPAYYQHWGGDHAEDCNGPFFFTVDGEQVRCVFRVSSHNCNAHGTLHGGVMMMFADYTLCLAAIGGTHEGVLTVTCNNEFIGPAFEGDLVVGHGEVTRKGGSLIFVRARIEVEGKTILTSSGVVKRVKRRTSV